jgi:serine/threonine protein kinase
MCNLIHLARVDSSLIYFIDYLPNGTLRQYLNQFPQGLSEDEAQRLFGQIYSALLHCHMTHFLVHRDIKLENILLDANLNAKVIDFGLSDTFYCNTLRGQMGTPGYSPPEVVAGGAYDEKCDVWSLGVTLYRMVAGGSPFHSKTMKFRELIDACARLHLPHRFSADLKDLLRKMLDGNPRTRPSLIDLQNHPFLTAQRPNNRPERVLPKPIVFYIVNRYEDISKFRRIPITPQPAVLEACLKHITEDGNKLVKFLEDGKFNAATATYFALVNPLYERPQASCPRPAPLVARKGKVGQKKSVPVVHVPTPRVPAAKPPVGLAKAVPKNTYRALVRT